MSSSDPAIGAERESRADRQLSSAARSPRNWRRRSARSSPPGSRAPASSIASAMPRSRCMTSSAACCASRPRPTTCPFSSTTARWNTGNGPPTRGLAPVKKTIYSLIDLREILLGCNRRYLAHLSALDDFSAGVRALDRLTKPRTGRGQDRQGDQLLRSSRQCAAACLAGPAGQYRRHPPRRSAAAARAISPARLSRQLRRLRDIGVIKRVTGTYRYYLTRIGRAATAALCRVTQAIIIPALI